MERNCDNNASQGIICLKRTLDSKNYDEHKQFINKVIDENIGKNPVLSDDLFDSI